MNTMVMDPLAYIKNTKCKKVAIRKTSIYFI